MTHIPELMHANEVTSWDDTADVVVIGFGIAGACAALEARRAGADVLVIERASGGGGASSLSAGIFYLGGGTAVQQAVGFEDTPEEMFSFLMASTGAPDPELVWRFCAASAAHFDWLEAQGVPFRRTYYKEKSVIAPTDDCLTATGNEKVWPYYLFAKPVPRGHKVDKEGDGGGALAMNALIARCEEEGVRIVVDSRVDALVCDEAGRICGARIRRSEGVVSVRARRGLVLAAGGFGMNPEYMREWCPGFPETGAEPIGIPHNDGAALELGLSAGAATQAMSGTIATASFYPPGQLIKGILVNKRGERFVAEDSYHGRTAAFIAEQPDMAAYLVLDAETFAYPEDRRAQHRLVDGFETIAEMEAALAIPEDGLQKTLTDYNAAAARGEDPLLHKHPDWVQPLNNAPYAAFEVGYDNSLYFYLTLGGIQTNADARVLDRHGHAIPGFYAAGACVSSIPQDGKGYASGLSLGPGSYFGRVAGINAARAAAND
ncbi:MAG: FAD-binding protein [Pseudomonadales bacterium]|jgi:succinate dehydrogenase/fumarate reductase flavoprotein subunit|nr:FAD-binding protein [Pseudomonadales bacterium]MDP6829222.1 FAD-binding protein [Pseudomonadales bacterium]MDP6972619.1 FAD-binding protein [Pseudomonadales bacterium]|tara:strand:+ start:1036 stop:2505 length:1470 start_codon:yes stop_codon:yes gene_type:complete